MLVHNHTQHSDKPEEFEAIHNYYEQLVYEELSRQLPQDQNDSDYIADIACVTLNHLPPRYIRFDVDMAFYLSPTERTEMLNKVTVAVNDARQFVNQRRAAEIPASVS